MTTRAFDVTIVGGGIIGLATAMELLGRFPDVRLAVLEKEPALATHQTAHNSGVIHSGIYYLPGSVKAKTCVAGARLLLAFCQAHGIPYEVCGKVVVAVDAQEVPVLERLYRQGMANGVQGLSMIGPERLRELEPAANGVRALHVPSAAIVDFAAVAHAMASCVRARGGDIRTAAGVKRLSRRQGSWTLETTSGDVRSRSLVTCGGLFADRLARMAGAGADLQVVPFRGEYYELGDARRGFVRGMIYPVPNPTVPFLGVHLTRTMSGHVEAGPNAILALKREGYRASDVSLGDTLQALGFPGCWRMARRYWTVGLTEWSRAASRRVFAGQVARLVPAVRPKDLRPGRSGVRAQAVDRQGRLVDDFNIVQADGAILVRNVPSPAATASIAIAQVIASMAESAFSLARFHREKALDPVGKK